MSKRAKNGMTRAGVGKYDSFVRVRACECECAAVQSVVKIILREPTELLYAGLVVDIKCAGNALPHENG